MRDAQTIQESLQQVFIGLQLSARQNMLYLKAPLDERWRDQNRAMARQRILFRAHQGHAVAFRTLLDPLDSTTELLGPRQSCVLDLPVLVAGRIVGACPKLPAQKDVTDPALKQAPLERLPVEL